MNEKTAARGRLHPAMFIVPVFAVIVTALPAIFVLLIIRAFTDLLSELLHQQISLFDGYFYIIAFLPGILLSVLVFLVTLIAYRKSTASAETTQGKPESQPAGKTALALQNDVSRYLPAKG